MSRLYGRHLICDCCRQPGQFGWVYRCSQDREDVIDYALSQGYPSTFDTLGDHFVTHPGLRKRKRSRAARESSLSFFDEITPQQMTTYRPDQIATILKQRDHVHTIIAADAARMKLIAADHQADLSVHPLYDHFSTDQWTEMLDSECEYQICAHCRPGAADRSFLSLNAVADGEIMPCAATGFGFHTLGGRPIADARIVRNIGYHEETTSRSGGNSFGSCRTPRARFLDLLHEQIDRARNYDKLEDGGDREASSTPQPTPMKQPLARLKHSPRYENLSVFSDKSPKIGEDVTKPPWTPPPSPSLVRIGAFVDDLGEQVSSRDAQELKDALERKRMLQDLDRIYELLGGHQLHSHGLSASEEGVAVLEESAECGAPDLVKQV